MVGRIIITFILVYLIPSMLLLMLGDASSPMAATSVTENQIQEEAHSEIVQPEYAITVLHHDAVIEMPLEKYVLSVTLAEMPADFELEALKAQAVVARTYTCKRQDEPKHENASVCTDSACCQAYMTEEAYLNAGGSPELLEKVKKAVSDTIGQVLMYQGAYIEATYFSCSGGRTEAAAAVWGGEVPYLQSVESPGEEMAAHYVDTVNFSQRDFLNRLGLSADTVSVKNISYTAGGGVAYMEICGKTFSGTEIRRKLDLRSTAFVITAAGNCVTVTTKGFGHRVGLSQYGAEAMAVQGKTYQQILFHYYQGTEMKTVRG